MSEPAKADRDLAYELERTGDRNTIAYALAAERAKSYAEGYKAGYADCKAERDFDPYAEYGKPL